MFNNKILFFFSVVAVVFVVIFFTFINNTKRQLSPVINSIPIKASIIVETEDFSYLCNKILKNRGLNDLLSELNSTKDFNNNLLFLDSILKANDILKKFINNKTVILSAHLLGENNVDFLFATSFSESNSFINKFSSAISSIKENTITKQISFGGAEITNKKFSNKYEIFYTFYDDYFLMSKSEILLQNSIKNINSGASYFSNVNFKTLYEKTTKKSDATLFLNYDNFFYSIKKIFNRNIKGELHLMQNFADWSAFGIVLKRKAIKLTGHTIIKPEMQYLKIFKDINPKRSSLFSILPAKTSSFLSFNIGSGSKFKFKYEEYLGHIRMLNDYQITLATFYKKYDIIEDKNSLYEITGNEIGLFYEDIHKNGKEHNSYGFLKYKNKADAKNFFNKLIQRKCNEKKVSEEKYNFIYKSNDDDYLIQQLPEKNILEKFYGVFFKNTFSNYVTFIDDFVIFGKTKDELESIINSYEDDKTFKRKSQDYSFINELSSQSNIFMYFDIFHSKNKFTNILNEKYKKDFLGDVEMLKTVQGPAIQFISDSYPIYTTLNLSLNSKKQPISETVWEVNLDTLIATKPFIVINHNTNEKEIVIQDVANKIYLINKNGKILWTRQLDGKIISKIYQIDFYKNDKLQLLFNTENKIYCIDRKGNWLEGYPVKLKSKATNGISVFDYDFNKKYRIFVATKNHKVYLYNKDGELVEGWNFNKTKNSVRGEIKLFKNQDKDYIVFRDETQLYILNRKGETRIKPDANVLLSKNTGIYFSKDNDFEKAHFSVSNPNGIVYSIFENGEIAKTEIKQFTKNHYYLYKDINGDNVPEYIFTDKNQTEVFNGKNIKKLLTYSYDEDLINGASIYNFSKNDVRIGTGSKNKIYLIDSKGHLCKGFPLVGTGLFSVGVFDEVGGFSLIVGNKDNYLYKYSIK